MTTRAAAWRAEVAAKKAAHDKASAELAECRPPQWSCSETLVTVREAGGLYVDSDGELSDDEALAMARWILTWLE